MYNVRICILPNSQQPLNCLLKYMKPTTAMIATVGYVFTDAALVFMPAKQRLNTMLQLVGLFLIMYTYPIRAQVADLACNPNQHYDTQRLVCLDRCGPDNKFICPVEDFCSANHIRSSHHDPSLCLHRCIHACDKNSYCNHDMAECRPCDTLCGGSDMDACRAYCYDVFITLPPAASQPSSRSCTAKQHYDTQRLVCRDRCGRNNELICPVEDYCSSNHILSEHYDPSFCLNRCMRACDTTSYCDHGSADCRPCDTLCDGSDMDACRALCYDVFTTLPLPTSQPSWSPCNANQHYDTQRLVCLDLCGRDNELICPLEEFCSSNQLWSKHVDPPICLNHCIQACDKSTYCDRDSSLCRPCDTLCDGSNMVACRAYCYDVFITLPPAASQSSSRSCTAKQHYDTQRLVCRDRCGRDNEFTCPVEDYCSSNHVLSEHYDPPCCLNRCVRACNTTSYCDHGSADCRPCNTLCDGSDMDACRAFCYDVFTTLPLPTSQPSWSPCNANQHYDTQRLVCLDLCGRDNELICPVEEFCTSTHFLSRHYDPPFCLNHCIQACDTPNYCDHDSAECRPCDALCDGSNMDACRAYCYDVYIAQLTTAPQLPDEGCNTKQYFDHNRQVCLDRCGVDNGVQCGVDQFCSNAVTWGKEINPPICLSCCFQPCDGATYCDRNYHTCLSCNRLCDGSNVDLCRIHCYDVFSSNTSLNPQEDMSIAKPVAGWSSTVSIGIPGIYTVVIYIGHGLQYHHRLLD